MTIASATYGDGSDALGDLDIIYDLAQLNDFPQQSGSATVTTDYDTDEAAGSFTATVGGSASTPFGSSTAILQGRYYQTITNNTAEPIDILFDYYASFDGTVTGSAEISGGAFLDLQDFFGSIFMQQLDFLAAAPRSIAGQTSISVGAGETVYASAYGDAFGTAFEFAPVPLPATMPLLLGAVAGLAGWRMRRNG
jgi:hypothetical protein